MKAQVLLFGLDDIQPADFEEPSTGTRQHDGPEYIVSRFSGDGIPLGRDEVAGDGYHIALVGPDVTSAIEVGLRIVDRHPDAEIIIIRRDEDLQATRESIAVHPLLGSRTLVISADESVRLREIVEERVVWRDRTTWFRGIVDRFNDELGASHAHPPDISTYFDVLLESLPVGVLLQSEAGEIVSMNATSNRLLNGEQSSRYRPRLEDYLTEFDRQRLRSLTAQARNSTDGHLSGEFVLRPGSGKERTVFLTVAPVRREEIRGQVLVILYDMTAEVRLREQLKAAEREAVAARQAAERADAAKTLFLANISHEFRTPMNAIIGFAELVSMKLNDDGDVLKISEYNDLIFKAGKHLLSLIEDVLDISSIELGNIQINTEEFDLWETVKEAVQILAERSRTANVPVILEPAVEPIVVRADQRAIRQIVINLVSNGLKFTPVGGEVVVSTRPLEAGFVDIIVADTGIGIDRQDVERIKQPFERVMKTQAESTPGVGLGLHLVNVLANQHGGSLDIESEPGAGTTVTVRLPLSR